MSDPLWFKDAVIYQLHVKTFADSNNDGVGDFRGLRDRLGYLQDLGVTAVWILPFYPSPLRDDGYDIADYHSVNPSYGTIEDFRAFLDEAHRRGLRVITELVLNHTSDQNRWFQRARRAPIGSVERDFYVWSDSPKKYREARIIFKDFEASNWTWDPVAKQYFWHRFYSHQPDLNFDNPAVHEALFEVTDFWLEMGVDGIRLDAVPYLYEREETNCENLPETHAFLKKLRKHIDEKFGGRMLLAEANQWPEDAAAYFGDGDECQMNFHFPLMPRMFMSLQMEDRFPIIDILAQTPAIHPSCQWATFLRNHDELTLEMVTDEERDYMWRVYATDHRARINLGIRRRLAPLMGNSRRRIELINSLLFSLPGTPIVYYGDEIGMGDNIYLGDRNGVRTPMQWSPDRNAGFSKTNPQQLLLPVIIDPEYHYESVNVENQQRNPSSLFWWMRRLISVRQRVHAFGHGTIEFLHPENAKVLAYLRRHGDEVVLVVANLSRFVQGAELNLEEFAGRVPVELFSRTSFPMIQAESTVFTLGPHDFYWFTLQPVMEGAGGGRWGTTPTGTERAIPVIAAAAQWGPALQTELETKVLPAYLPTCRWFGGKGEAVRELKISEAAPVRDGESAARLLIINVAFVDAQPETYVLPAQIAEGTAAERILAKAPHSIIARFSGERAGILFDAMHDEETQRGMLELIALGGMYGDSHCRLVGTRGSALLPKEAARAAEHSHILSAEQSNTSVVYGSSYFLKLYRKLERGPNPDAEITRYLSEERQFPNASSFAGSISLAQPEGTGVIALLVGFTPNQGDAWGYTLDALARFFERVLAARGTEASRELGAPSPVVEPGVPAPTEGWSFTPAQLDELIGGVYPERARQLGQRTGELHLALAAGEDHPAFAPEPFTTLWQRSLYQAMRGLAGRTMRTLRKNLPGVPASAKALAESVLMSEPEILERFARITSRKITADKIAVHGDYHLGQVLNTGKDFIIIDFEGEPRRSIGERRLKRSPLIDVAGMVRSFDYAAHVALSKQSPEDALHLAPWAEEWVRQMSAAFTNTYFEATRGASFIPADPSDVEVLLDAFILDKAIYEVGYELTYRPDFVGIPLRAVAAILSKKESAGTPLATA